LSVKLQILTLTGLQELPSALELKVLDKLLFLLCFPLDALQSLLGSSQFQQFQYISRFWQSCTKIIWSDKT
jgi:hypothetical protein